MSKDSLPSLTPAAAVGLSLLTGVILVAPSVVAAVTGPPDQSKIPDDPTNTPSEGPQDSSKTTESIVLK